MSEHDLAVISKYFGNDVVRARFREILGRRESGIYIASVMLAVADNPKLQTCSLGSIYTAALRAATLRLSVDPNIGQAYLVPFKDKATLIVGYKGLYDMAIRTNRYRYLNVGEVWEGETVEEDRRTGFHKITGAATSKKVIGYIAAFEQFSGYAHDLYMTVEKIHEHAKRYSKSYNFKDSGWQTDPPKMERKTVLRMLLKHWGYMDPIDAAVLTEEDDDGIVDASFKDAEEQPEQPKRTADEIITELGFEPDKKEQPTQEPAQEPQNVQVVGVIVGEPEQPQPAQEPAAQPGEPIPPVKLDVQSAKHTHTAKPQQVQPPEPEPPPSEPVPPEGIKVAPWSGLTVPEALSVETPKGIELRMYNIPQLRDIAKKAEAGSKLRAAAELLVEHYTRK